MENLSLRQLRYFQALSRHRHFGRAAEACSVSQPALSVQIKDLERTLGAPLVERGGRQIRLTALGETVAAHGDEILRAVDDLGAVARARGGDLSGPLRLGVIPTIAPYLLPDLIARLARAFPDLDPVPREARTARLVGDLHDGQLDVAILALPLSEPALEESMLFSEEFLLVRPRNQALAPVPGPEGLREMRLLLLEEGHCFRDQALSFCGRPGAAPREVMEGSALTTLVQMVGAGIGVTLIPQMAARIETRMADVDIRRLPAPRPARTIGMVWRRSGALAAQYAQLADLLRDGFAADGAAGPVPVI